MVDRELTKSNEYLSRAKKLIPCVTQTLSKGPTQYVQGVAPIYLERGNGCHVWDVDGNEYIDYVMALGPVIRGYAYPRINEAITKQLRKGISLSLMHPLEVEVAEVLTQIIPCAEMVRFSKNGADVTAAAVRLSRAYTRREKIAKCGYHGWLDWSVCNTTRNKGVPEQTKNLTLPFKYNQIETLEKIFSENKNEIAAVIMEPIGIEEPTDNFLKRVKDLVHENEALLVFDEIVTGFRISLGGAQEFFGVIPDLACFGKAMANGMPISALVGKKEVMKDLEDIFFSLTFGGETLSLAASLETIKEIREKNVIKHIWDQGNKLKDGYNKLAREFGISSYTKCEGWGPRTVIKFVDEKGKESQEMKSLFQQELLKRGILWIYNLLSYSHSNEDIEKTLEAYVDALTILKKAIDDGNVEKYLEGEKVQQVFRQP